jgi:hypothetical protein
LAENRTEMRSNIYSLMELKFFADRPSVVVMGKERWDSNIEVDILVHLECNTGYTYSNQLQYVCKGKVGECLVTFDGRISSGLRTFCIKANFNNRFTAGVTLRSS